MGVAPYRAMAVGNQEDPPEVKAFTECSELLYTTIENPESLAWKLFSVRLISKETRTKANQQSQTREYKMTTLLEALETQIVANPRNFYEILKVMPSEQLKAKLSTAVKKHGIQRGTPILLASLQETLENLKKLHMVDDESNKAHLVKNAIENYIKKSNELKTPLDEIKQGLNSMNTLLSDSELSWSMSRVDELVTPLLPDVMELHRSASSDETPLFSKEVVYHASLCCLLVSTNSDKHLLVTDHNRHLFEEVSISKSKDSIVDRYLIARQGKTYYVAFKGELILNKWKRQFKSFEEGIGLQSTRIPLRFFIEQLNNGYKLVLTGFSFGGLLASSVSARLFQQPYLTSEQLVGSLLCVTFGHPLLSLREVAKTALQFPLFKSILHCIFMEDDVFPQLMQYTEIEISASDDDTTPEPTGSVSAISDHLCKLQAHFLQGDSTSKDSTCINEDIVDISVMKKQLKVLNSQTKHNASEISDSLYLFFPLPADNVYKICLSSGKRLECKKLLMSQIPESMGTFSSLVIDSLPADFFLSHSMVTYHLKVMRGFLECFPAYKLPQPQTKDLKEVALLKPSVKSVSFHQHGKELAVVIEGDNLWFCYSVKVSSLKAVETLAGNSTRRSIQFNYTPQSERDFHTDETVGVKLLSHFSNPIRRPAVQVIKKVYEFTFRQQQLAKLTPSELIEVACMSALLEQHPFGEFKPLSHRFVVLRRFLEAIGSVVPLESIFYAIAGGDPDVAVLCCEILKASNVNIPPSVCAITGIRRAILRLQTDKRIKIVTDGLFEREVDIMTNTLFLPYQVHVCPDYTILSEEQKVLLQTSFIQRTPLTRAFRKNFERRLTFLQKNKSAKQIPVPDVYKNCSSVNVVDLQSFRHRLAIMDSLEESPATTFEKMEKEMLSQKGRLHNVICSLNIELLYPITKRATSSDFFSSPLDILQSGREDLAKLRELSRDNYGKAELECPKSSSELCNSKMLEVINKIRLVDLGICTTLLGAFMEEQMKVPLKESSHTTAKAISSMITSAAVGVWFLFSLVLPDINNLLASIPSYELLVQVKDYIKGIFSEDTVTTERMYAGKLQFMVQGLEKTVSCNSQYISYSLERQLVALCDALNISADMPTKKLVDEWDTLFKKDVLSLVTISHRPLVARWMKWALMIHNLREELAKYTAVGVVGLVNSGKSRLVNSLFKIQIPVGTTEHKRTTVPFLYNLDEVVEGLDVIDFPGVDDRDETIPDLADLLLSLAQVVVFVVDYRRVHTESAKHWLDRLEADSTQLLVCLTFADQLYEELMSDDGTHPPPQVAKKQISTQLDMIKEKLGSSPSRVVKFFSFSQSRASVLNTPSGRQTLRSVGICDPVDVGDWLVETFRKHLDQEQLASNLYTYIHKESQHCSDNVVASEF